MGRQGVALSVTIGDDSEGRSVSSDLHGELNSSDSSAMYRCSAEDLLMGARFFDFDLEVVERAMGNDETARKVIFDHLERKLDRIERQIERLCPGWPQEHRERVRDLFVHDRFIKILFQPPKSKIENFNALCWKFLYDSIADAWRYYRSDKRNFKLEISADKKELETDEDFWNRHGTEICLEPSSRLIDQIERSDLVSLVNGYLNTQSPQKEQVISLWMIGHSEKEIASKLNMTVGNVGSVVNRTLKYLRGKLCKNFV